MELRNAVQRWVASLTRERSDPDPGTTEDQGLDVVGALQIARGSAKVEIASSLTAPRKKQIPGHAAKGVNWTA